MSSAACEYKKKTCIQRGKLKQKPHSKSLGNLVRQSGDVIQVNSALHSSEFAKSSTNFGWGKCGKVTAAGWQVTPCSPKRHVIFQVAISITNCYIRFMLLYSYLFTNIVDNNYTEKKTDNTTIAKLTTLLYLVKSSYWKIRILKSGAVAKIWSGEMQMMLAKFFYNCQIHYSLLFRFLKV